MSNLSLQPFVSQPTNDVLELFETLPESVGDNWSGKSDASLLAACRAGNILIIQGLIQLGANVDARGEGGNTPLMICTELSLTSMARVLIENGADINAVNSNGETALILSVYTDTTDMMKLLLEHPRTEKEHQNNDGYTALMCAIECLNWAAVFLLFDANANFGGDALAPADSSLDLVSIINTGVLAEQIAKSNGSLEVLQMLKHCKARGIPPLEQAVLNRDLPSTMFVLKHLVPLPFIQSICAAIIRLLKYIQETDSILTNVDAEIIDILLDKLDNDGGDEEEKQMVLELAVEMGNFDLVQILSQRGFVGSDEALGLAVINGRCDILQLLIDSIPYTVLFVTSRRRECLRSALKLAILNEEFNCAKTLISGGAEIDLNEELSAALTDDSEEVLQFLTDQYPIETKECFKSTDVFHVAVKMGDRRIINAMLDHGADVNLSIHGKTALMHAFDPIVVDLLLERGADVNLQVSSSVYGTALHYSLSGEYRSQLSVSILEDIVRKLLENGANVNLKNTLGQTPLNLAAQMPGSSRIIRLLVNSGADVNERCHMGKTMLHIAAESENVANVEAFIDAGVDVNLADDLGRCALFVSESMENICVLLDKGANANSRDGDGNTILMKVLKNNYGYLWDIGSLIEAGCDVNLKNHKSRTALMMAAKSGNEEALTLLLEAGADVNAVTEGPKKKTALKLCLENLLEDDEEAEAANTCCQLLLEHKASIGDIYPSVIHQLIAKGLNDLVKLFIHAGLGPTDVKITRKIQGWFKGRAYMSPLCVALLTYNAKLAHHLFHIKFLTKSDLTTLSSKQSVLKYLKSHFSLDCAKFLEEVSQKPLSLESLCFIVVSSASGSGRRREERIRKTGLPTPIQDALLFRHKPVLGETTDIPCGSGNLFMQHMDSQYMGMSLLFSFQKAERMRDLQSPSESSEDEMSD